MFRVYVFCLSHVCFMCFVCFMFVSYVLCVSYVFHMFNNTHVRAGSHAIVCTTPGNIPLGYHAIALSYNGQVSHSHTNPKTHSITLDTHTHNINVSHTQHHLPRHRPFIRWAHTPKWAGLTLPNAHKHTPTHIHTNARTLICHNIALLYNGYVSHSHVRQNT